MTSNYLFLGLLLLIITMFWSGFYVARHLQSVDCSPYESLPFSVPSEPKSEL